MKKRNMATLALLGLATSFLITSQGSAHEEVNVESTTEGEIAARGSCHGGCSGSYRSSPRDRRYGGSVQRGENPPPPDGTCGGTGQPPSGSCHGNGYPPQGNCHGGRGPQGNCHAKSQPPQGGCHGGYSKQDNMQNKRNTTTK